MYVLLVRLFNVYTSNIPTSNYHNFCRRHHFHITLINTQITEVHNIYYGYTGVLNLSLIISQLYIIQAYISNIHPWNKLVLNSDKSDLYALHF